MNLEQRTSQAMELAKRRPIAELLRAMDEERTLRTCEIAGRKKLGGGINVTDLISLKGDGRAVYKPRKGEGQYLKDKSSPEYVGIQYKNEVATAIVSEMIGFGDLVPATVLRKDDDGDEGSAQRFLEGARTAMEYGLVESERTELFADFSKMFLLDIIVWNRDRHDRNFMVDETGENGERRLRTIDNGLAFGGEDSFLKTRFIDKYGEEIRVDFRRAKGGGFRFAVKGNDSSSERVFESRNTETGDYFTIGKGSFAVEADMEVDLNVAKEIVFTARNEVALQAIKEKIIGLVGEEKADSCIARIKKLGGAFGDKKNMHTGGRYIKLPVGFEIRADEGRVN